MTDHFQAGVLISAKCTDARGCLYSPQSTRVWHNNALDILDNISARFDGHFFRDCRQYRPCDSRTVGNCDGFRTSHGGNKFPVKNIKISLIYWIVPLHLTLFLNISVLIL